MNRSREGGVFKDECDMMGLKVALGVVSFCVNMLDVRKDATDSALKFLVSSIENRKNQSSLSRENILTLECFDSENSQEEKMIRKETCDFPKVGGATNEIVSSIEMNNNESLDTPVDDMNFDFSELIDADSFLAGKEDEDTQKKT